MSVAAPKYLGEDFSEAPPGHRFRLYFSGWKTPLGTKSDDARRRALELPIGPDVNALLEALCRRTESLARRHEAVESIHAESRSPLLTGLGMEHPIENGFAFLDPYGLPYLPGASIKGVIRRAAEELVLFQEGSKWSLVELWWLFGFDATSACFGEDDRDTPDHVKKERQRWREAYEAAVERCDQPSLYRYLALALGEHHRDRVRADARAVARALVRDKALRESVRTRGIISWWDSFPRFPESHRRMRIDIVNPHHRAYFERGRPPSDDEDPRPNFLLAIPPKVTWTFYAELTRIEGGPASAEIDWRARVSEAFDWAARVLGFGAKTAVGYGRLERLDAVERRR